MVHAHGGQHRQFRGLNDIRGVQRPAQAGLQNHHITAPLPKVQEGGGGDQLKLRGMLRHRFGGGADLLRHRSQVLVGNFLPINPDTLVKPLQMGRGIQPHPVSRRLQNRRQAGANAALAVGPGHVDTFQLPLGISQPAEQFPDAAQARSARLPAVGPNVGHRLFSRHDAPSLQAGNEVSLPQGLHQRHRQRSHDHGVDHAHNEPPNQVSKNQSGTIITENHTV